jgi:DHA1 family multidrug resistance protein-like MFS transporter
MTAHRNDWRRTIALFALVGFTESLAFGHLHAFTPLFLRELGVREALVPEWTGILSAVGWLVGLPLLPFWGVWADRYGRKLVIVRSSVAAAMVYALAAASRDVTMLACARFLTGFVLGNTGVMMAVQADITPRERLGSAVAIINAGSPVGMAVGPYFGGLIVKAYGIRQLFFLDSLLTAIVVSVLIALLREEPRSAHAPTSTRAGLNAVAAAIRGNRAIQALYAVMFLVAFGMSISMPYVPILIEKLFRGPRPEVAPTIGKVLTISGVCMALTTPWWGRLGDRLGHLRVLRGCVFVSALTIVAQALSATVLQMGVARAAQGVVMGGLGTLSIVLLTLYTPTDRRSAVLNLALLPQQLAWFIAPLIGSAVVTLGLRMPFWIGALTMLGGLAASLALHPVARATPASHPAEEPAR